MARGLYWFRYDLRLDDNPSFLKLSQCCSEMICVYVFDQRWFHQTRFQTISLGRFRGQFILESLYDLKASLNRLGQELYVLQGNANDLISQLIEDNSIDRIGVGNHPGFYEQKSLSQLMKDYDELEWLTHTQHTLWQFSDFPLDLNSHLSSFSKFRKAFELNSIDAPMDRLAELPVELDSAILPIAPQEIAPISFEKHVLQGGEQAALFQLQYYLFSSRKVLTYKQTRNQLEGWDFSSKLSAWLAQGCVSPRRVINELRLFEKEIESNESTYWLFFEMLWREYFQWLAFIHGPHLFAVRGISDRNPLLTFYPEQYQQWINGNTESSFVNAFMRQLNATGWMSNRGRQIVASYFVNELGLDWRFGAAYFEQQLIDYDVASNWGNWQYLSGVGTDPRGKRRFNIEKQENKYDPSNGFKQKWINSL